MGGFGQKSKDGAISLVKLIIEGKPGESWVMRDKVGQVPKVVPIKFASRDHAIHSKALWTKDVST